MSIAGRFAALARALEGRPAVARAAARQWPVAFRTGPIRLTWPWPSW